MYARTYMREPCVDGDPVLHVLLGSSVAVAVAKYLVSCLARATSVTPRRRENWGARVLTRHIFGL